jgi:hypothetical protein
MTKEREPETRVRTIQTYGRVIGLGLGAILLIWLVVFVVRTVTQLPTPTPENSAGADQKNQDPIALISPLPFRGTLYESSGVVGVPDGDGVLFVDDSRPSEVFWTRLDESGRQVGHIEAVYTEAGVDDPESITTDGSYYYIVGSQSNPGAGKRNGFVRFRFDPATRKVSGVEKIEDVRGFILASLPELKATGEKPGADGGLAVDGLAWDPNNKVLLLGLRSPMIEDQALIIPIKLKNPGAPLTIEGLERAGDVIRLRLGDLGVRDICYDKRLKSFLIIAGVPKDREKGNFSLWRWDGRPGETGLRKVTDLDGRLKPEGITSVTVAGNEYLFLVFDSNSYAKLDYSSIHQE